MGSTIGVGRMDEISDREERSSSPGSLSSEAEEPVSFNQDLPSEHRYLGENMETVGGRVILAEGSVTSLPLIKHLQGTLVPGQTFPLVVQDFSTVAMLSKVVEGDHTFGCVHIERGASLKNKVGTTAEIFEFSQDRRSVSIKAKARQRFKVLSAKKTSSGYYMGQVRILPEVIVPKPLDGLMAYTYSRASPSHRARLKRHVASMTAWPAWVYQQYDIDRVKERVHKELPFIQQGLRRVEGRAALPKDPTDLSFWLATHLNAEERYLVLQLNSPIHRLRLLINLMRKHEQYWCQSCNSVIAAQEDVLAMSIEGAQATYINPDGFHHDTITFRDAWNLSVVTAPSSLYSWFPGYSWSVAVCEICHKHIGWQFVATQPHLRPRKFWGLSRQSLDTGCHTSIQDWDCVPIM